MKVRIGPYRKNKALRIEIDDYDMWNADHTLALIIVPLLKKLKENSYSFPSEFSEPDINSDGINYGGNGGGHDAWLSVLDQMINGFAIIASDEWPYHSQEDIELAQHGINLFAKYYMNLWN